jgi:glutamyl-tRNA reductase
VLGHLDGAPGTVALLGVSPMTRRCAALLNRANVPLLIVNRTLGTARELAQSVAAPLLSLDEFRADPPQLSALVLAAGGSGPVLDAAALVRLRSAARGARERGPLIIDFGVPPNIDAAAAERAGLDRVGMTQLIEAAQGQRLTQLLRLAPVRAAIDERLAHLRAELATRALGPRLQDLRARFEEIAAEEVARALRHELRTLDEQQRAQLERLGCAVAHRLAHLPLAGLRAAAVHASADAVDAFFDAAKSGRAHGAAMKDES